MKIVAFLLITLVVGFFLISCNGNGDKRNPIVVGELIHKYGSSSDTTQLKTLFVKGGWDGSKMLSRVFYDDYGIDFLEFYNKNSSAAIYHIDTNISNTFSPPKNYLHVYYLVDSVYYRISSEYNRDSASNNIQLEWLAVMPITKICNEYENQKIGNNAACLELDKLRHLNK